MSHMIGVSRFKTRSGVYLFGKIRRTDFLPVAGDEEAEVTERGILSESSDGEDDGMDDAFGSCGAAFDHPSGDELEDGEQVACVASVDYE